MNKIPKGEAPALRHELRKMESLRRNWVIVKKEMRRHHVGRVF